MKITCVFIFLFFFLEGIAQTVSGKVVDSDTNDPLIGANVRAFYEQDTFYTVTDVDGRFQLERAGTIMELTISYLGYRTKRIIYDGSSEMEVALEVNETNIAVSPIIIANPFLTNDVSFNRKEFQILPGAYEDPSRLLLKAPGFSTSNDQANSILYRGFPSNFINWNINNALTVNPNHLSNAGTLSDVSSANAGGVNMLSGQVIGTFDFNSAPYDLPGNNSIAGNSNVNFSDYNNSYLNLSLIGLEAGLGYEREKMPGAQLNYRYSTVGILTGPLGLDFGGEEIIYQDLFGKLEMIDKEKTSLEAFIALGRSSNNKAAIEEVDSIKTFKDLQSINFKSDIFLSGLSFNHKPSSSRQINASVNFSRKLDERRAVQSFIPASSEHEIEQNILSFLFELQNRDFTYGINSHYINDQKYFIPFRRAAVTPLFELSFQNVNFTPYIKYQKEFGRFFYNIGLGTSHNTATGNLLIEPHVSVIGEFIENWEVKFSYRKNSQLLPKSNFTYDFVPEEIIGNHGEVTLKFAKPKFQIFSTVFYHHLSHILVSSQSNYSQFTGLDFTIGETLELDTDYTYNGKARSYGTSIGFNIRDLLFENLTLSANATFFDAAYSNGRDQYFQNTFSFDRSFNAFVAYVKKLNREKELVISLAYHNRGGLREFPIDEISSSLQDQTIFDFSSSPAQNLADYQRVDFRVVYNLRKSNGRRFAKSISLDIQNLTNRENEAFNFYDPFIQQQSIQNQLGLIPVLAYRIEF